MSHSIEDVLDLTLEEKKSKDGENGKLGINRGLDRGPNKEKKPWCKPRQIPEV